MAAADINMTRGCSPGGSLASDPMLSTETSPASHTSDQDVDEVLNAPMQVMFRPRCYPASSCNDGRQTIILTGHPARTLLDVSIYLAYLRLHYDALRAALVAIGAPGLTGPQAPISTTDRGTEPYSAIQHGSIDLRLRVHRITAPRGGNAAGTGRIAPHAATTHATATLYCSRRCQHQSDPSRRRQLRLPRCEVTCRVGRRSCTACSPSASWTAT